MKLTELIEELRLEMQRIASDNDLTDPRVVRASQRLDVLINKFYFYQREKKRSVKCSSLIVQRWGGLEYYYTSQEKIIPKRG